MDRIERIREMEERMDRVAQWIEALSDALKERQTIQADTYQLSVYYESGQWREDYEADEAGEIPADLKRGVLSEDGLYDLLDKYNKLIHELREIGEGGNQ